jgi:hypothetical protein
VWLPALAALLLVTGCQVTKPPTGPAGDFADSTDMFKKGHFDRALNFSEAVAKASPANAYTERAQVLRLIIYGGRVKAYNELADAYGAGAEKTKSAHFKAAYERLQNDAEQNAAESALGLAQTAHQMMSGKGIGKEVVLELPYPDVEGPTDVAQLEKVKQGEWIEPAVQEAASLDARRKGIDDELAEAVSGDRSKARSELTAGPVKIDGLDFSIFLTRELLNAATAFDHKHYNDIEKLKIVAGEADDSAQAALAMLKENPDKDKEKTVKKLEDDIKEAIKKNS